MEASRQRRKAAQKLCKEKTKVNKEFVHKKKMRRNKESIQS